MPEGHSIRFFASVHDKWFVGSKVTASSPQGRFVDEAAAINGQKFLRTSTHGKHLFFHFDAGIVHIHLGLYGRFTFSTVGEFDVRDTTRLRIIVGDERISDLSGPTTCSLLVDYAEYEDVLDKLGPDPLDPNADREIAWRKIKKSNKSIASLLMNQSVIAGIGNMYRAELLFICRIDPFKAGKDLERIEFDMLWQQAANLLMLGSIDGIARTVNPEHMRGHETLGYGAVQTSYVYMRHGRPCRLCNQNIMADAVDGRTLYWCSCQA